jgi:hypothetical protein
MVLILCLAALAAQSPAERALGDEPCQMGTAAAQPARRVPKAIGLGTKGSGIPNRSMVGSTIDPSRVAATNPNPNVVLRFDLEAVSEAASHAPLGAREVWPASSALFPEEQATSPDNLR